MTKYIDIKRYLQREEAVSRSFQSSGSVVYAGVRRNVTGMFLRTIGGTSLYTGYQKRHEGIIVLYCIVLYCIVLYCIVLYCIVLYRIVLYCARVTLSILFKCICTAIQDADV